MGISQQAIDRLRTWHDHPVIFVRECFKVEPDPWQIEVLEQLPYRQRIGLVSCKGPGKTALLAWIIWWFIVTRAHPKIAATSISWDNLADGLWTELAKWQAKSKFLTEYFEWTKTRIAYKGAKNTWWASARTWSKSGDTQQQANTLAGLHADDLLFILDEVGGIPDSVMAAAEAGLANDLTGLRAKMVIAGNPTHLEGPLYRASTTERHLWWLKHITADPDDPQRTPRVSKEWARAQIEKYGKDNPWVLINVFGKFPPSSVNSLLSIEEVQAATKRSHPVTAYESVQKRIGIDVSRFGNDRTVLFPRQGLVAFKPVIMRNARTNEIAARIMMAKNSWGSELELVDDTGGFGSGVIDQLLMSGTSAMSVNFSGAADNPRYFNKRAEMYFRMSEWIKKGGALPNDSELMRELTTPTYWFNNGKLQLESKDQIKSRLGFSPDLADSLALTFAIVDLPSQMAHLTTGRKNYEGDYDPFSHERV